MEILIKREEYNEAMELLLLNNNTKEWNTIIEKLKNVVKFLEFFKDFVVKLDKIEKLKLILNRIFELNKKDQKFQEIVYDIVNSLINSRNYISKSPLIRNLCLIQAVKLSHMNQEFRFRLKDIIKESDYDTWFINLLITFEYYDELAYLYELEEDYENSLKFYEKINNVDKINEINEKLEKLKNADDSPVMLNN